LDERDAIMVTGQAGTFRYCGGVVTAGEIP
jgi:hypothetical protein